MKEHHGKARKELDVHQQKRGYNMFRLTSVLTCFDHGLICSVWMIMTRSELEAPTAHHLIVILFLLLLAIYVYYIYIIAKKINCKASIRSFDESNSKAINVDGSKHVKSPIAITNWERAQLPTQVLRDQARRCILVGPVDHGLRGLQRSKLMFILQHLYYNTYIYYTIY